MSVYYYNFTVTEEEANLILLALQELPAKFANPITTKLRDQALLQKKAEEERSSD